MYLEVVTKKSPPNLGGEGVPRLLTNDCTTESSEARITDDVRTILTQVEYELKLELTHSRQRQRERSVDH
jgi:hypothetical protein